jgi:hypothetical protein
LADLVAGLNPAKSKTFLLAKLVEAEIPASP